MRAHTPGRFVWRAHLSAEPADAQAFYGALFGWRFESPAVDRRTVTLAKVGDRPVCGFLASPQGPAGAHWAAYLSVEDVDGAAAIAATSGGHVVMPPTDMAGQARCAVIADPQGARVHLLRAAEGDAPVTPRPVPFTFGWETLHTTDETGAVDFYCGLAPWHVGELLGRRLFVDGLGAVADVQPTPPGTPSHWLPYVVVAALEDCRRAAVRLGGIVQVEALPLPGVGRATVVQDPTGAVIGLLEPGR
jgi:predicted enzyme related to lactoylglutathione lyase